MDGTIYHLMETKIRKISHWMGKIEEHQPCKSDVIEGGLPCHEASISWVCLKIRCPSLDPLVPPEIPEKAVKVLATPLQWHSLLWSTGLKWPSVFSCFFEAKNMRIWWEYRYGPITWDWTTRAIRVFIPFSNIEPIHFGVSWFWLCLSAPWRCNLTFLWTTHPNDSLVEMFWVLPQTRMVYPFISLKIITLLIKMTDRFVFTGYHVLPIPPWTEHEPTRKPRHSAERTAPTSPRHAPPARWPNSRPKPWPRITWLGA
jgi:hypothetical protein